MVFLSLIKQRAVKNCRLDLLNEFFFTKVNRKNFIQFNFIFLAIEKSGVGLLFFNFIFLHFDN